MQNKLKISKCVNSRRARRTAASPGVVNMITSSDVKQRISDLKNFVEKICTGAFDYDFWHSKKNFISSEYLGANSYVSWCNLVYRYICSCDPCQLLVSNRVRRIMSNRNGLECETIATAFAFICRYVFAFK